MATACTLPEADPGGLVSHATGYPYERPACSYLLVNGTPVPLNAYESQPGRDRVELNPTGAGAASPCDMDPAVSLSSPRVPVLAIGSNAAPGVLAKKLACLPGDWAVPVLRARIADLAVVYSAHYSAYGAIPATLGYFPGVHAEVFVMWLTHEQLVAVHATESLGVNYRYADLRGLRLVCGDGPVPVVVGCYISLHGCLLREGRPVALSTVRHRGGPLRRMGQRAVMRYSKRLLGVDGSLGDFIRENVADAEIRRARTARLRTFAEPLRHPEVPESG
jgi:hypothetical protein